MDFIIYWLMAFLPIILLKIAIIRYKNISKAKDSMLFTEAIGLPLTFMQPVIFFMAIFTLDYTGVLITAWWGAGFLFVAFIVLKNKYKNSVTNWGNSGIYISWLCKVHYIMYVFLAFIWDMPKLIFVLSAWIASDQIEKTFASVDADRTRRTFHDYWVIRLMYPVFLFIPFFYDLHYIFKVYGTVLFIIWLAGILYVIQKKEFMNLPEDPSLLRNMIYFRQQGRNKED